MSRLQTEISSSSTTFTGALLDINLFLAKRFWSTITGWSVSSFPSLNSAIVLRRLSLSRLTKLLGRGGLRRCHPYLRVPFLNPSLYFTENNVFIIIFSLIPAASQFLSTFLFFRLQIRMFHILQVNSIS